MKGRWKSPSKRLWSPGGSFIVSLLLVLNCPLIIWWSHIALSPYWQVVRWRENGLGPSSQKTHAQKSLQVEEQLPIKPIHTELDKIMLREIQTGVSVYTPFLLYMETNTSLGITFIIHWDCFLKTKQETISESCLAFGMLTNCPIQRHSGKRLLNEMTVL